MTQLSNFKDLVHKPTFFFALFKYKDEEYSGDLWNYASGINISGRIRCLGIYKRFSEFHSKLLVFNSTASIHTNVQSLLNDSFIDSVSNLQIYGFNDYSTNPVLLAELNSLQEILDWKQQNS